ncbi:MAG: hypothetical protein NZ841_08450, partial [Dictyoglomus sp.]|nr:hypothetical protein [Dictyoglomus sp.]MDW8189313.1 hypothetical protein [Dictyoglomus sp.]
EYASVSYTWIVGATLKPVTGLELYGEYRGDNKYKVSAKVTTIPNVTVKGEYSYKASEQKGTFYAWVKLTQSLPVGSLTVWSGYRTSDNKFAGYARLSTPVGPATNVLLAHYNTGGANDGFMTNPNDQFTLENTLSVSF